MHGSITVHMAAPPEKIWPLVSDVTQIGRFSPETFEAEWVDGATGPAVGAKFRGHVKRNEKGPKYWTTCTVLTCDENREFAFGVGTPGKPPLNTWTYKLAPSGDGTDVTESFALQNALPFKHYWMFLGWARGKRNCGDMQRTLDNIKAAVEA
jgi:uncharacterized protein YndB with AHSA1/START domain